MVAKPDAFRLIAAEAALTDYRGHNPAAQSSSSVHTASEAFAGVVRHNGADAAGVRAMVDTANQRPEIARVQIAQHAAPASFYSLSLYPAQLTYRARLPQPRLRHCVLSPRWFRIL